MSDMYLTEEEIPVYCSTIDGVTSSDVAMATDLINSFLGRSFVPKEYVDRVKLSKTNRGKLSHSPIIEIESVTCISDTLFGRSTNALDVNDIELDTENDGYFTYIGSFDINMMLFHSRPSKLEIKYKSGFNEYPKRLKTATAMLACNIRQAQSFAGAKQLTSLDFNIMMTDDSFFTSDIKMLLRGLNADVRAF